MSNSGPYRIAEAPRGLKIQFPHQLVQDGLGISGKFQAIMGLESAFARPGVERTSFISSSAGDAATIGGPSPTEITIIIPNGGGNFSVFDRLDLSITVRNTSLAPVSLAPAWALIRQINWEVAGLALQTQYGESLFVTEAMTKHNLAVLEMDNCGFTSRQISQITRITPAVGGGTLNDPTILSPSSDLTLAPGASYTYLLPVGKDVFLTTPVYAPQQVAQPIIVRITFNPGLVWCSAGNSAVQGASVQLIQCGRVYQDVLQTAINDFRRGKEVRICAHQITLSTANTIGVTAGQREEFTLQNFVGNYALITAFLRTRTPNAQVNGVMDWFFRSGPQVYDIATGVQSANASVGDNYALTNLDIFPDGSTPLYSTIQRTNTLRVLMSEACDNEAYILAQSKAITGFPFSDRCARDLFDKLWLGGAVNLVSAGKIEYVPVSTIPDASLIVIGWKELNIWQNAEGLLSVGDVTGTI